MQVWISYIFNKKFLNHFLEFSDIEDEAKTRTVILEAGLVLTKSISIGPSGPSRNYQELATPHTPTNFPRGILTPERSRRKTSRREQSFKAVSFNPKAEFKLLEDVWISSKMIFEDRRFHLLLFEFKLHLHKFHFKCEIKYLITTITQNWNGEMLGFRVIEVLVPAPKTHEAKKCINFQSLFSISATKLLVSLISTIFLNSKNISDENLSLKSISLSRKI